MPARGSYKYPRPVGPPVPVTTPSKVVRATYSELVALLGFLCLLFVVFWARYVVYARRGRVVDLSMDGSLFVERYFFFYFFWRTDRAVDLVFYDGAIERFFCLSYGAAVSVYLGAVIGYFFEMYGYG